MMSAINPSISTLAIIVAVCLIIGYVFGWLVSALAGERKKDKTPEAEEEKGAPALPAAAPVELPKSLLRLERNPETGGLTIVMAGKPFPDVDRLDPDERKQLLSLLQEVSLWLKKGGAPGPVAQPTGGAAAAPDLRRIPPPIEHAPEVSLPQKSGGITDTLSDMLNPGVAAVVAAKNAPLSIVGQIDAILQTRLAGTELGKTKIYMTEDAHKNVVVCVGSKVYDGIGAMPEGEIKELVKSCVREWERSQERPGHHS